MVMTEQKIISGQALVETIRTKCDSVSSRLWIASPYIGDFRQVHRILGDRWMDKDIDVRVITDNESGFIKENTYKKFIENGAEVKHVLGLHAKIYIVDNWCLVTSANLTGTAFSSREEIGCALEDADDVMKIFEQWWSNASYIEKINKKVIQNLVNLHDACKFPKKYKLPKLSALKYDKYHYSCSQYRAFAELYESVTGRNKEMIEDGYTLLQEVDFFFNYLYHNCEGQPSFKCDKPISRTTGERLECISEYFNGMCQYYSGLSLEEKEDRVRRSKIVQTMLSESHIQQVTWEDIEDVVNCLHCMRSLALNKVKFLNKRNNTKAHIIDAWRGLLHGIEPSTELIEKTRKKLYSFSYSSISELIGWYYPEKYPIMNYNSDCGMRLFGYKV